MKRAFLLIVAPALLVALGFAQTPAASINTDQTNIKGCLGGSDGNYTVVENNTGHIFKITGSGVDLKAHLGHDVTLIGHKASGASSVAADSSFAVTELNMISEHCAAAAAVPTATVSTPSGTASTPPAAAAAPDATISTLAENTVTPAVTATPPAATVTTPAETTVPAVAVTPPGVTTPVETTAPISTPAETAVTPPVVAAHPPRLPASPRKLPATPAVAAAATPAATASTSSEPVSTPAAAPTTPAATASTSSEPASTPAAAPTTPTAPPTAPTRGGSLWLLIAFVVLVIVIGTLAPSLSRWRKGKNLERAGAQNLSFTREASSDKGKSDEAGPRKAA